MRMKKTSGFCLNFPDLFSGQAEVADMFQSRFITCVIPSAALSPGASGVGYLLGTLSRGNRLAVSIQQITSNANLVPTSDHPSSNMHIRVHRKLVDFGSYRSYLHRRQRNKYLSSAY